MPPETSVAALSVELDDGRQHRPNPPTYQIEPQQTDGVGSASVRLAYSIPELAFASGFSRAFLYLEVAAGRLILRKKGRRSYVTSEDAHAWLCNSPPTRRQSAPERISIDRQPQLAPTGPPEAPSAISVTTSSLSRRRPQKHKAAVLTTAKSSADTNHAPAGDPSNTCSSTIHNVQAKKEQNE